MTSGWEMSSREYSAMATLEDTHFWYRSLRRLVLTALRAHLRSRDALVLDVGCGTGGGLAVWSRSWRVAGLELSSEALRHCVRRGVGPLVQGAIHDLPLLAGTCDVVVCLDVLSHAGVDATRALAEMRRVLRPGGVCVVNVPAFGALSGQHDAAVRVARRYRRDEIRELMNAAGFAGVRSRYWNTLLFPAIWLWRRLRRGIDPERASSDVTALPGPLNALLGVLLRIESAVLGDASPFGTSVLSVGLKPSDEAGVAPGRAR